MFNVGDTIKYKADGQNPGLRGKVGEIIKIEDGKKTVKFKGVAKPVLVKGINMEILDAKKPVGAVEPEALPVGVVGRPYKKGDKVIYFCEPGDGRFGDANYNGKKGVIAKDQGGDADFVEVTFPDLDPNPLDWYVYNIRPDAEAAAVVLAAGPIAAVAEPAAPAPVFAEAAYPVMNPRGLYKAQQAQLPWKIGDKVRVLRTAEAQELGWHCDWNGYMTEAVGKELTIANICERKGFRLGDYWYPWFVLQYVAPAEVIIPDEKFLYKAVNFTVGKDFLNIGNYRFPSDELIEKLALAHARVKGIAA